MQSAEFLRKVGKNLDITKVNNSKHNDDAALKCLEIIRKAKQENVDYKRPNNYSACNIVYFGFNLEEIEELKSIIKHCQPDTQSKFPDFLLEDNLIEHFHVTSSIETKKGSKQHANRIQCDKIVEQSITDAKDCFVDYAAFDNSYDFLVQSIQHNWGKHVRSLKDYKKNIGSCTFIIDYTDIAILNVTDNEWYRISKDNKALLYLYENRGKVDNIIFVNDRFCEVIRIDYIPSLIKLNNNALKLEAVDTIVVSEVSNL